MLGKRIGAFSYGSGLAASMFSFTVTSDMDKLRPFCNDLSHLSYHLNNRIKVMILVISSFEQMNQGQSR